MTKLDKKNVKKILIIKLRGIGDVILSTIVLKNLLKDFPNAEIHYLTEQASKPILDEIPYLRKVFIYPRRGIKKLLRIIYDLRREKYDLILDFFSNNTTGIISLSSGARYRGGFPYRVRKMAYNLFGPAERNKYHAAILHLEFLKELGIFYKFNNIYLPLNENVISFANNYLNDIILENRLLIGISPSGGWISKKCDPSKFAEIADHILQKYNATILILWGPSDYDEAIKIMDLMKYEAYLAPPTDILQMTALISKCSALIANDSGPMHLSTAVGTPVLSLHGPTNPLLQGPYGSKHEWIRYEELSCITCNLLECPKKHECFLELPINRIIDKFHELLNKNNLLN